MINGELCEMPPATGEHQLFMDFLVAMINSVTMMTQPISGLAFSNLGLALSELYAPTPDITYLRFEKLNLIRGSFVEGVPDLVVEILSTDRNRDLVMKRAWYANAGIPEYWVVDPVNDAFIVLELAGSEYAERAVLSRRDILTTPIIPGLALPLEQLFGHPARARVLTNR